MLADRNHPYPFGESSYNDGLVTVFNSKDILLRYCSYMLGKTVSPKNELYRFMRPFGAERDRLISVQYPTPDGWKVVTDKDCKEFWKTFDLETIFSRQIRKEHSEADIEEMAFVYLAVVRLREQLLLDAHNQATAAPACFEFGKICHLQGPMSPDALPLHCVSSDTSDFFTTTWGSSALHKQPSANYKKLCEFERITLENSQQILDQYISFVLGVENISFQDEIFGSFVIDDKGKPIPQSIRFPTPIDWAEKKMEDYNRMWDGIDLNDHLNSMQRKTEREKRELGLCYLAVIEIQKLGYMDGRFKPFMTPIAQAEAQRNCCLGENERGEACQNVCKAPPRDIVLEDMDTSHCSISFISGDDDGTHTPGPREDGISSPRGQALNPSTLFKERVGQFDDDTRESQITL